MGLTDAKPRQVGVALPAGSHVPSQWWVHKESFKGVNIYVIQKEKV
jgi:hypothetical protein